jgi:CheY-like chemotaxis protein
MKPLRKVIMPEDVHAGLEREQSFLDRSGIKIFTTVTNEEAIALHRSERADLIIAYLNMPGMKGDTLCSLIREDEELRRVSIILVCPGNAAAKDDERCVQCGANSFITMPISSAVLLQEAYQLLHVAPRRSCRIPVDVKIEGMSKGKTFVGLVENISTSGMLFRSIAILNEGDSVKCSSFLPGYAKINVKAEIVRTIEKEHEVNTRLYGVRFISPDDDVISAIEKLQKRGTDTTT